MVDKCDEARQSLYILTRKPARAAVNLVDDHNTVNLMDGSQWGPKWAKVEKC